MPINSITNYGGNNQINADNANGTININCNGAICELESFRTNSIEEKEIVDELADGLRQGDKGKISNAIDKAKKIGFDLLSLGGSVASILSIFGYSF